LDKRSGKIIEKITLPTRASHLLVIPGKKRWAFVEKGSVQAFGQQDVKGLLLIPTSWIEQRQRDGRGYDVAINNKEEKVSPNKGGLPSPGKPVVFVVKKVRYEVHRGEALSGRIEVPKLH
jgi:hypothetical protein